ncbi:AdoMet_MTases domain containing protein [Comamonadaceae bacterium]
MNASGDLSQPVSVACALCTSTSCTHLYPLQRSAIVKCNSCGFCYVNPRMSSDVLKARLQAWAQQDVVDAERLRIAYEDHTLALYDRYLKRMRQIVPPGRLLDVGCSTGALMFAAQQQGWSVEGLEIGEVSAAYAAQRLQVPVHAQSLYDFVAAPGSYDAIAFLEVIEHLENPVAAVQQLNHWLRPGGVLLVSTPNFDSLFRRLFGTRWWVVNCEEEHIQLFNRHSLEQVLQQHGFDVTWTHIRGLDVAGLVQTWRSSKGNAASQHAHQPDEQGYHGARTRKEKLKSVLAQVGLIKAARLGLYGLDLLSSARYSPLHAVGEQLVMLAVKR